MRLRIATGFAVNSACIFRISHTTSAMDGRLLGVSLRQVVIKFAYANFSFVANFDICGTQMSLSVRENKQLMSEINQGVYTEENKPKH